MTDISIETITTKTLTLHLTSEDVTRIVRSHIYGLMAEKDEDALNVSRGADAVLIDVRGPEDDFPTIKATLVVQLSENEE